MRVSNQRRGHAGQAAIMKAAMTVFSRKGFEQTSVEEICLAAGYSKGGFYFHFRSKNDLLLQMLESDIKLYDGDWPDALTVELWAEAERNEKLRAHLADVDELRCHDLVEAVRDEKYASTVVDLLSTLEDGLQIQQRFCPTSAERAKDLLHSLIETLRKPSGTRWTRRRAS